LGVTAIWIGPVFKQRARLDTYHGYGIQDGAVALAATAVEQRDLPHENAPSSPCSGSTV
jgi:hypothetical protein